VSNAQEFSSWNQDLAGWAVRVTTYRIEDRYYCHVDNVSPGATIARAHGAKLEEAKGRAMERAKERLAMAKKRPS
jgi:hypothetical protein